jgi:hypothetical protein
VSKREITASGGVAGGPLHEVGGVLVGAEEEELGLAVVVDDLVAVLDHEEVEQARDVLLEGELDVRLGVLVEQNRALGERSKSSTKLRIKKRK